MHAVEILTKRVVVFISALLISSFVYSEVSKTENLFVFVFKNGVAQSGIEVQVGQNRILTDEYGKAAFTKEPGDYEVGYFENQQLFALADVTLQKMVSSQIFLNLKNTGADVDLDLPLSSYEQEFDIESVKEQTGPKGTLQFTVLDSVSETPIAGAKLFFRGYAVEGLSNEQGIATVELSEGEYDISVVHPKYVMQVTKGISITAEQTTPASMKLIKSDIVLDEFVVSAPFVEGSFAANLAELKDADVVGDAISSEQFSKSGDSDAAGALKRVTGITIVDDKFVFVRGLGERYSTVLFNDLEVPSPEPTKRVVPLDIFPAGIIQSLDIQKTYSANLPGTFAGGTVQIVSKDIPKEDNYISGSISVTMNQFTGEEVINNPDNDRPIPDFLIRESDGFNPIQDEIRIGDTILVEGLTPAERNALDSAMVNYRSYGIKNTKLEIGSSLSTSFGQSFKTSSGWKYGFAGNLYYKNENKAEEDSIEKILLSRDDSLVSDREKEFDKTSLTEKYGGLVSFGFEPTANQKLKYTFLGVIEAEDQTKLSREDDIEEDSFSESVSLRYIERELFSHQLNGEHGFSWSEGDLFGAMDVSWGYSISTADRFEPGTFDYEYKEAASGDGLALDRNKMFYLYSELEDEATNYRLDLDFPFRLNGRENKIEFGFYQLDKERTLDNRRFKFNYTVTSDDSRDIDDILTEAQALTDNLFITSNFLEDDAYDAEQDLSAFYASALVSPFNQLDVYIGARQEDSTQEINVGIEPASIQTFSLETSDLLPFLGLTYRLDDEHQFRFGYSQTLTRPDFREFSPTRYKDPETDFIVRGNPDLDYTEITNIDIKYEWFPSFNESLSFGIFTKDFTSPIETLRRKEDEDIVELYANAESAQSYGLELGFRKSLDGLIDDFEHYFVEGNYAWIDSEINLREEDISANNLTTNNRPMQGQSPYVANLKFGYDNFFTKRSAILLYNVFGERITALGVDGVPDTYEQPFHRLDFVVKWGLNDTYDDQVKRIGYAVNLKLKNLLNNKKESTQGNTVVERSEPGMSATLGFSMKF